MRLGLLSCIKLWGYPEDAKAYFCLLKGCRVKDTQLRDSMARWLQYVAKVYVATWLRRYAATCQRGYKAKWLHGCVLHF